MAIEWGNVGNVEMRNKKPRNKELESQECYAS